jgi:hypothetical protein
LKILSSALQKDEFISDATNFNGKFECEGVQKTEKKVQWLGTNVLLGYLLDKLIDEDGSHHLLRRGTFMNKAMADHFLQRNGKPITRSSAKAGRASNNAPNDHKLIDDIIQKVIKSYPLRFIP